MKVVSDIDYSSGRIYEKKKLEMGGLWFIGLNRFIVNYIDFKRFDFCIRFFSFFLFDLIFVLDLTI